jgi:Fe-S-cluster-containing dehydrogenase component
MAPAMRYSFVLDQTRCIGCHACTVACKSENEVALGTFRTWVKYIEKGDIPDARRHFAVLRCNQCDDAPCVTICPTTALFKRKDGIVDFDSDACIGCKSCMQACPYDALYIDPATQTAAKCNFCSHRVDQGLQPACQIVCPTQAIISGDLDDPESPVSLIRAREVTQVRKPDQRTKPRVFYVGADDVALDPRLERVEAPLFTDEPARFEPDVPREVYDVRHATPWGWKVWSYLWTKSVAAGLLIVAAFLDVKGALVPATALAFIAITTALLVFDLKRPERFWYLMVRPNFRSWLVWGGYALGAFGALSLAMCFVDAAPLRWAAIPIGALAAGYTAFLFNQCEGRDFWQSRLLLPHLLAEAVACGGAALVLLGGDGSRFAAWGQFAVLVLIVADLLLEHENVDHRVAAKWILDQPTLAWLVLFGGASGVLLMFLAENDGVRAVAALLILSASFEYGRLWIKGGQVPKLS